ncbi:hypothetical protein BO71DRAFT_95675 [Aspergillus ellipticus CBS 707.79]|uniref:Uncharacterized protein n=1 Tax=Aspergillus ellipticus CBS 707.79 TaxID=1448320 RepID=A0A319DKK0_9EURO|nr:hypothetical protein BO71DRAFT_95675 [Aspergillus ellipticus CBS 707.79]
MVCVLPSILHARFVEYEYCRHMASPFPRNDYLDTRSLCIQVLKLMSKQRILNTRQGNRIGIAGQICSEEGWLQDEFYRCCWNWLGSSGGMRRYWSMFGQRHGSIEFTEPGWSVDLSETNSHACWDWEGRQKCCQELDNGYCSRQPEASNNKVIHILWHPDDRLVTSNTGKE